jgi:histidine triad (HIT) family protein
MLLGQAESKGAEMPIDATQAYDDNNIFAKILRGELPSRTVYEDEHALAFHDINPLSPVHILVIPKGKYVSWDDFSERASEAEIAGFVRAVGKVARDAGMAVQGYRLLANTGKRAGQEVPHLHVHIFGGQPLGPMLAR